MYIFNMIHSPCYQPGMYAHKYSPSYSDTMEPRPGHDQPRPREGLVDTAIRILAREAVGRRDKDGDLPDGMAQRGVEPLEVGHQDRQGETGVLQGAGELGEHVVAVGELGHPLGRDARGRLDGSEAGLEQALDEGDLDRGWNPLGDVLEAIARSDFDDADGVLLFLLLLLLLPLWQMWQPHLVGRLVTHEHLIVGKRR